MTETVKHLIGIKKHFPDWIEISAENCRGKWEVYDVLNKKKRIVLDQKASSMHLGISFQDLNALASILVPRISVLRRAIFRQ